MVRKYTDPRSGKNYNFKDEDLTIQQMQEKIDAYEKTQAPQQAETQQPPKPSFDKMYQDPDTENSTNDEFLKNGKSLRFKNLSLQIRVYVHINELVIWSH